MPPVRTLAFGHAVFQPINNNTRIAFQLVVRNIARVTKAHIHLGRRGQEGPIVVTLFGPSKFGISVRNGVIRGIICNSDLKGPLAGKSIRDLIRQMNNGNTYVNVHTKAHPNGEIRGQIVRSHR